MPKRYPLNTKIEALDLLDQLNGDLKRVASQLSIPAKTLSKWSAAADRLRHNFTDQQDRRFDQLLSSLHIKLLERAPRHPGRPGRRNPQRSLRRPTRLRPQYRHLPRHKITGDC